MQGGEPYVFEDPARPGALVGFEVEIAAALARELGVRAEFVQNDWSSLVPTLERGTLDVVLNGLEVTEARRAAHPLVAAVLRVRRAADRAGGRGAGSGRWAICAAAGSAR